MKKRQHGFTLVELSIVLVILGLLVGGVLTGQSLIRAAELRSVSTQFSRFQAATMTFRDKYFALPGDMTNAQSYWGIANATPATCTVTVGTGTQTCNGDGNGKIDASTGSNEGLRFWQHLANAGLIEGTYSGVDLGGLPNGYDSNATNVPAGKLSSSFWYACDRATITGNPLMFNGQYDNIFEFGGLNPGGDPVTPNLKPEEAYNIDMKMDDGKPATGKVVARAQTGLSNCTDTVSDNPATLTANYRLNNTALGCALHFPRAF